MAKSWKFKKDKNNSDETLKDEIRKSKSFSFKRF